MTRRLVRTKDICNGCNREDFAYVDLLKDCTEKKDVHRGTILHSEILKRGLLGRNPYVASTLISMYAKCGILTKAQNVLDELSVRNVVSWCALISGYAQQGHGHDAIKCFEQMKNEGLYPDGVTFICMLKACGEVGNVTKGSQIHDEIIARGLLSKNIMLCTALVDMYAKCGILSKARELLDEISDRDIVSWSALITGYAEHGQGYEAISCYTKIQSECLSPNTVTLTCILKACGSEKAIQSGKQIHHTIITMDILSKSIVLGTALVDMYAKCGVLTVAQQVLDELPIRNIVSWNVLIAAYAQEGQGHEALRCFEQMQREGLSPNEVTFICTLKACGNTGDSNKGKEIHQEVLRRGMFGKNITLGNALVDMYAKCGMLAKAHKVLMELPVRDRVSWNSLIAGYTQQDEGHHALSCFKQMQSEGLSPDAITYVCILKACSTIGAFNKCKNIHDEIASRGLLEKNIVVGNTLVDMYAKFGMLSKAQDMLRELPIRDTISWNALITGYAQQGQGFEALNSFEQMQMEGLFPDAVTILCLLNACSHSGLVNEAETYFVNMSIQYGIPPNVEHHACIVDVFGCAGHFDKAMSVVEKMCCSNYPPVWLAILSACKKWGNVMLGSLAFEKAVQLDSENAVYYVLMSSIYVAAGMLDDAKKVEAMIKDRSATKNPRNSFCDVDTKLSEREYICL